MNKWNAEDYNKNSSAQQLWARELIAKLTLKGDEQVLDIGCGDGKVTAEIAMFVPKGSVVGVDNSAAMIKYAKEKYPNIDFICCDARNLDFENEFDVVFSSATLHWIIDHLPVLNGIARSLKPSGRVLLQMGGEGNACQIFEIMDEMLGSNKWRQFFKDFSFPYGFYGVEKYKQWLNLVNLKAKRVELIPKDMVQKGKAGLYGWIRTTWMPYLDRIPQVMREEFIEELADKYVIKYPLDENGHVHVKMVRLEVEAEK